MTRTLDSPGATPDPAAPEPGPPARRRPVLVGAITTLVVFLVVVALVVVGGDDESGSPQSLVDNPAPDVELVTLDGQPFEFSQLEGSRVIVNFFNDWCAPCREELPAIQQFTADHADDPTMQFVWIARDYTESAIRRWVADNDPAGIVLLDPRDVAAEAFNTRGQPETYGIDATGVVRTFYTGQMTVRDFEAVLAATGAEAPS